MLYFSEIECRCFIITASNVWHTHAYVIISAISLFISQAQPLNLVMVVMRKGKARFSMCSWNIKSGKAHV